MLAAGRAGLMGRKPPEAIVRRSGQLVAVEPRGRLAGALGALPQPADDRPPHPVVIVAAHLVHGGVLGALDARWRR